MTEIDQTLAEDLLKIARMEAKLREQYHDDQLTIFDVEMIIRCAEKFGVSRIHAYYRAKELGLLSYQPEGRKRV